MVLSSNCFDPQVDHLDHPSRLLIGVKRWSEVRPADFDQVLHMLDVVQPQHDFLGHLLEEIRRHHAQEGNHAGGDFAPELPHMSVTAGLEDAERGQEEVVIRAAVQAARGLNAFGHCGCRAPLYSREGQQAGGCLHAGRRRPSPASGQGGRQPAAG